MNLPRPTHHSDGLFIALEGLDGSGKTTLAHHIMRLLEQEKIPAILTREPGGTPFGKELRAILQYQSHTISALAQAYLFAADRTEHIIQIVKPGVDAGKVVLSDRTYLSSLVYQAYAQHLNIDDVVAINSIALQGYAPNAVIYLDISAQQVRQRICERGEQQTSFEQKPLSFFLALEEGYKNILAHHKNVCKISATQSSEDMALQAVAFIKGLR